MLWQCQEQRKDVYGPAVKQDNVKEQNPRQKTQREENAEHKPHPLRTTQPIQQITNPSISTKQHNRLFYILTCLLFQLLTSKVIHTLTTLCLKYLIVGAFKPNTFQQRLNNLLKEAVRVSNSRFRAYDNMYIIRDQSQILWQALKQMSRNEVRWRVIDIRNHKLHIRNSSGWIRILRD